MARYQVLQVQPQTLTKPLGTWGVFRDGVLLGTFGSFIEAEDFYWKCTESQDEPPGEG